MPVLSIIIPAYNEEAFLPRTLESLGKVIKSRPVDIEVIVVDNNSTDNTASIAGDWGARVVFEPYNQISRARNAGAGAALSDFLVFLDADTELNEALLWAALERLQGQHCCGGGTLVRFEREVPWLAQAFLNCWNWLAVKLSLAAGCFIYCRRDAFEDVGGFSEEVYASEEIWLSRAITSWGRDREMSFDIITDWPISTSVRKVDWYSQGKLLVLFLPILLFPPLVRVQSFCKAWYRRPNT